MIGFTYLHLCLFIYFSGRGDRLCVIRNHARWMIQRPRLTDKSWHLMYVAVGQSPPGPFPGVNSQLECQKQYTSLSSLFFPCSLRRHTFQALKRSPKRNLFVCLFCTQREVTENSLYGCCWKCWRCYAIIPTRDQHVEPTVNRLRVNKWVVGCWYRWGWKVTD